MLTITNIYSTPNGVVESKVVSNNTETICKSIGQAFTDFLIKTTPDEVKKNNPKWKLD
jgi:hypothetical protein